MDNSPKAITRAIFSAMQRGKSYLVGETPVDRGILKNAWKVIKLSDGVELVNDQPYAGIVENGARPFKMSSAGISYLKGWVMRMFKSGRMMPNGSASKIAVTHKKFKKPELEAQAESIAWAIAKHFEKEGMKGKKFVLKALPKLATLMDEEITRYLGKFFDRQSGSKS